MNDSDSQSISEDEGSLALPTDMPSRPRPLATKPIYSKLFRSSDHSVPSSTHLLRPRQSVVFKPDSYKRSTNISSFAKRSHAAYAKLEMDQDYLLQLRRYWEQKLEQLQADHRFLTTMATVTESQAKDASPMFRFKSNKATATTYETENDLIQQAIAQLLGNPEVSVGHDANGAINLDLHHALHPDDTTSEEMDESSEENQSEDEEETRRALDYMLAHYGVDL